METTNWRPATAAEVQSSLLFIKGADLDGGMLTLYFVRNPSKLSGDEHEGHTAYRLQKHPWLIGAMTLNQSRWVMPFFGNSPIPRRACIGDSPTGWLIEEPG